MLIDSCTEALFFKNNIIFSQEDFSVRLPDGWLNYIHPADQQWIEKTVFTTETVKKGSAGSLKLPICLWYDPPAMAQTSGVPPKPEPDQYFRRRLCLWVPMRKYKFEFHCQTCELALHSHGFYPKIRSVLDVCDWYYLATEFLTCKCGASFIGFFYSRILEAIFTEVGGSQLTEELDDMSDVN